MSKQGNKNLIGPNPIRQPGAGEAYKGSLAPATSKNLHLFATTSEQEYTLNRPPPVKPTITFLLLRLLSRLLILKAKSTKLTNI